MLKGIDFSFGSGLTVSEAKAAGVQFVGRYLSGGMSKDITKAELDNWLAGDVAVIFFWETNGIMTSQSQGANDALAADRELKSIGASGAPVFFTADAAVMPDLHGYLQGTLSVVGKDRNGIYGGIGSVASAFNAGLVSYGCQTTAWSNGQWDDRALLRQLSGGRVGPANVDFDEAAFWNSSKVLTASDDFGQFPRPSKQPPPPPTSGPPFRQVVPAGNLATLDDIAQDRNWSLDKLVAYSLPNLDTAHAAVLNAYVALDTACQAAPGTQRPVAPTGLVYYTEHS